MSDSYIVRRPAWLSVVLALLAGLVLSIAGFAPQPAGAIVFPTGASAPSLHVQPAYGRDAPTNQLVRSGLMLWGRRSGSEVVLRAASAFTVAAEGGAIAGARGLSNLGGIIEETGANGAGGRIFTSTGAITQSDFAGIVNSAVIKGDQVSILTGAHGLADGTLVPDASLLTDDEDAFGDLPGVHVYDVSSMSPAEIQSVLNGPGTIIGAFCDSGACLARYGG